MEKPEENTEKKEETTETAKKSVKIDGISSQINLVPNSPRHRQFARLMTASGLDSPNEFMQLLMDSYETPHTDNSEVIANLKSENETYGKTIQTKDAEIANLKKQLEAANKTANENAVNGLGKQSQIEELQKQLAGKIRLDPVSAYYINELAKDNGMTSDEIVSRVILGDLQNPCANWWPKRANGRQFYVDPDEVRQKLSELKNQQNA